MSQKLTKYEFIQASRVTEYADYFFVLTYKDAAIKGHSRIPKRICKSEEQALLDAYDEYVEMWDEISQERHDDQIYDDKIAQHKKEFLEKPISSNIDYAAHQIVSWFSDSQFMELQACFHKLNEVLDKGWCQDMSFKELNEAVNDAAKAYLIQ